MTTLANIFGLLSSRRESLANDRRALIEQTGDFEKELAKLLGPWASQKDPLSECPWLSFEDANDGVAWRKRVRLFNGHFLDFVITRDARFYLCTSDGIHVHYDRGFTSPSPATHMELRLDYTRDGSRIATPLLMVLEEHIERLAQMPELQEDGTEVGGG